MGHVISNGLLKLRDAAGYLSRPIIFSAKFLRLLEREAFFLFVIIRMYPDRRPERPWVPSLFTQGDALGGSLVALSEPYQIIEDNRFFVLKEGFESES